ncbi:hypothetical protein [Faecalibacterium wellingii]|jgi:hypothetical protein
MQNTPPKWEKPEKGSKNKAMRKIADGFYGFGLFRENAFGAPRRARQTRK